MSERLSVAGNLPDGEVPEGQEHNPNPPDQVAANRARFEDRQHKLQADRRQTEATIEPLQQDVEDQYRRSITDPAHRAVIPEQIAHSTNDPVHDPGGKTSAQATGNPESDAPLAAPLLNDTAGPAGDAPHRGNHT